MVIPPRLLRSQHPQNFTDFFFFLYHLALPLWPSHVTFLAILIHLGPPPLASRRIKLRPATSSHTATYILLVCRQQTAEKATPSPRPRCDTSSSVYNGARRASARPQQMRPWLRVRQSRCRIRPEIKCR